jgi:aspartyl-tRNA synthetase
MKHLNHTDNLNSNIGKSIEMSFVNEEDIINLIESLLVKCWPFGKLKAPFKRMKYTDAINLYGVDKPD